MDTLKNELEILTASVKKIPAPVEDENTRKIAEARACGAIDDQGRMQPMVAAIRKAAGSPRLEPWERFSLIASQCIGALSRDLGERYSPSRATLENFTIYHQAQQAAISSVRAFIDDAPISIANGCGIVLYGPVGTGKDHLLAAAMYVVAASGVWVRWVSGQELYGQIRDSMDTGRPEDSLLNEWEKPCLLGISDPIPPVGTPSEWNTMQLYRLLDRRYRAKKSTWISVNALSIDDADVKLSAPVFDRIRHGAVLVPCFWPSFRERKVG